MRVLKIEIELENGEMVSDPDSLRSLLVTVANKVIAENPEPTNGAVRDGNGNKIGSFWVTDDD